MCRSKQTPPPPPIPPERQGDVDDLIFRYESQWKASDR